MKQNDEEFARPPISPDEMAAHREALEQLEDEITSKVAATLASTQPVVFVEVTGKLSF